MEMGIVSRSIRQLSRSGKRALNCQYTFYTSSATTCIFNNLHKPSRVESRLCLQLQCGRLSVRWSHKNGYELILTKRHTASNASVDRQDINLRFGGVPIRHIGFGL